jgi:mannose-6-phosphate isomerase-like protein (cupin superfamily)
MPTSGLVLEAGQAKKVEMRGSRLDYLLTGKDCKSCSFFELEVAPGFDTGAHYHTEIEEFFFMLEGELELRSGERIVQARPGTFVFIPKEAVHYVANRSSKPARVLMGCVPSGHENYFDELAGLLAKAGPPDPEAISALRRKYDTFQLSSLHSK